MPTTPSMSPAELAATPTGPTLSAVLDEAAQHVDGGPHQAIRHGLFGSTDYHAYIGTVTTEHTIAMGWAYITTAGLIDPTTNPTDAAAGYWSAGGFAQATGHAHWVLTQWAEKHTPTELGLLFAAAADRARSAEQA